MWKCGKGQLLRLERKQDLSICKFLPSVTKIIAVDLAAVDFSKKRIRTGLPGDCSERVIMQSRLHISQEERRSILIYNAKISLQSIICINNRLYFHTHFSHFLTPFPLPYPLMSHTLFSSISNINHTYHYPHILYHSMMYSS